MIDAQRAGSDAAVGSQPRGRDVAVAAAVGIGLGVLVHALLAPGTAAACDRLGARAPGAGDVGPRRAAGAPDHHVARSERAPRSPSRAARPERSR